MQQWRQRRQREYIGGNQQVALAEKNLFQLPIVKCFPNERQQQKKTYIDETP